MKIRVTVSFELNIPDIEYQDLSRPKDKIARAKELAEYHVEEALDNKLCKQYNPKIIKITWDGKSYQS